MYAAEIRRQVEAARRAALPAVTALLWRAYGDGKVTEPEAEELAMLIEARTIASLDPRTVDRVTDPAPLAAAGIAKRYGSRPRSPDSLERRRRWAASGRLPPALAAKFTLAEAAVLAVIAVEVARAGVSDLHIEHIAARAGVSRSSVKNAVREAKALGLVTVELRKRAAWRNESNLVRVISGEWLAWMRLARRETRIPGEVGGVKSVTGTNTGSSESGASRPTKTSKRSSSRGASDHCLGQDGRRLRSEERWRPTAGRGRP